ncbi:MAG: DUF2460 domain-containing protein [Planctomycetaceae bacterium]|nr:DUF2460 domain-containing protein [Planctomycetaceae bacterium]
MIIEIRDFVNAGGEQIGGRRRMFEWFSDEVTYDTGKRQANQILARPRRHWWINWLWLNAAARDKLIELFNRARGKTSNFLYECVWDYACTYTDWSHVLTTGEATTQLKKTYYAGTAEAWTENKTKIQPSTVYAPTIKVNGAAKVEGVDFTLNDDTGMITWTGFAPTTGQVLTADYKFYFEAYFAEDTYEDINHTIDWYRPGELHLVEEL